MTDTPVTAEPPKPADPPGAKKQLLDNLALKYLLTLAAWLAPLPVTIVLLKCWFEHFAPADQSGTDPFAALRHTITSFTGATVDFIPFIALIPSIILLSIIYRTRVKRIFVICALVFIAVGEIVAMMETWGQQ